MCATRADARRPVLQQGKGLAPSTPERFSALSLKPPIHWATLLPATVANNNVVPCMAQCCAIACWRKMLPANRESLYFSATVAV